MRKSRGGLHWRRATSSSPSRPPHQQLLQAEVGAGMADGQADPLLDIGLLNQLHPYRRPPSSSPLYRLDAAGDLTYSMDEEEDQMVLVQPYSSPSCSTNPATYPMPLH